MAVLLLVGALLAVVWRLLTPTAAGLGDDQEAAVSVDGSLSLLGLLVGVVTGVFVLVRPGRSAVWRTVAVILGSVAGGLVSWLLGDQLGTPPLRAVGAAFTWPIATATVIFLGSLMPITSTRLNGPRLAGPGSFGAGQAGAEPYGPGPFGAGPSGADSFGNASYGTEPPSADPFRDERVRDEQVRNEPN